MYQTGLGTPRIMNRLRKTASQKKLSLISLSLRKRWPNMDSKRMDNLWGMARKKISKCVTLRTMEKTQTKEFAILVAIR